jgi:hypothetical protein
MPVRCGWVFAWTLSKPQRAYNNIVYPKGGFVLHMLRYLMQDQKTGDKDFIDMMHDFVATYTNHNRQHRGLQGDCGEAHEARAGSWMAMGGWTGSSASGCTARNCPAIAWTIRWRRRKRGKVMLTAKVTQADVSEAFRMRVPVVRGVRRAHAEAGLGPGAGFHHDEGISR